MIGPALIVIALLVIPVLVIVAGAAAAVGLSFVLKTQVDQSYEGTEYIELS